MTRFRIPIIFSVLLAGVCLFAQRAPIAQQLTFSPYHANGIYKIGETVGWTVTPGPVAPTYAYKWTIRRNNAVVLKEGKLDLSSGQDKIEIEGDQPEMIYVAIEPYATLAAAAPAPGAATSSVAPAGGAGGIGAVECRHPGTCQPSTGCGDHGRSAGRREPGRRDKCGSPCFSRGPCLDWRQYGPQQRIVCGGRSGRANANPALHTAASRL